MARAPVTRSPFLHRRRLVHHGVTAPSRTIEGMGNFLVIAGIVVFVVAMLGLVRGLDRI